MERLWSALDRMAPLWHAIDRLAPGLHNAVALLGKVPAGVLSIGLLIALWFIARKLAFLVLVLPGAIAGFAAGAWLCLVSGWHPLICFAAGFVIAAVIFQILANFFYLRLVMAVIIGPLAVLAIWHLAAGALDTLWAIALTCVGAWTVGSLLQRFVTSENHELYMWTSDLIEELRGE